MEQERSLPVFTIVYKISGRIGGITNVISYDNYTKELLRNNIVLKKLSNEEEQSLIKTFSDNGFLKQIDIHTHQETFQMLSNTNSSLHGNLSAPSLDGIPVLLV
jgi:hypothetical protein